MKLRTQFLLGAAALLVVLLLTAAFFFYAGVRAQRLEDQRDIAVSAERRANDLGYLSNNYLLYQETLQVSRWESALTSLARDVDRLAPGSQEEQLLLASMKENIERLDLVFQQVVSGAGPASGAQVPDYDPTFLQVSWGRLEVQNRQIVSDATRLHQLLAADLEQANRTTALVTLVGMGLFALLLLGGYFLMYRRTTTGLAVLQAGTKIVGRGDLDFRIPETRRDEIGELSGAFNRMTAELKGLTVSKADLEREIAERELVEQEREVLLAEQQRLSAELTSVNRELRVQNEVLRTQQDKLAAQNTELEDARDKAARLFEEQRLLFVRLQQALLDIPKDLPGVRFGHLYRSATQEAQVGGDFYDVFEAKNGQIGLLIGDVSGHGIDAARTAALTKDTIRAFSHQFSRPHLVLRETNRLLIERRLSGFVTVFLGFLDLESGTMLYSSAGHPPPIVAVDGSVTTIQSIGVPLAAFPDSRYRDTESRLDRDSIVLLYTDGITEARKGDRFFGEQGLIDAIREIPDRSVEELPSILLQQARAFSGGQLADDVALLAVHYTGASASD